MNPSQQTEILREIQVMMKQLFDIDEKRVQASARLIEDLDLDSLDAIDLAVKVEQITGCALDEQRLRSFRTIEDVVIAIDQLIGPAGLAALRAAQTSP